MPRVVGTKRGRLVMGFKIREGKNFAGGSLEPLLDHDDLPEESRRRLSLVHLSFIVGWSAVDYC